MRCPTIETWINVRADRKERAGDVPVRGDGREHRQDLRRYNALLSFPNDAVKSFDKDAEHQGGRD